MIKPLKGISHQRNDAVFKEKFRFLSELLLFLLLLVALANKSYGQADVTGWGNLRGIRIDGQLMKFQTSLRVVGSKWNGILYTAKEHQKPHYSMNGKKQIIDTQLGTIKIHEIITNTGRGRAKINVTFIPQVDTSITGAYFCIGLPESNYMGSTIHMIGTRSSVKSDLTMGLGWSNREQEYVNTTARGAEFKSTNRQLQVTANRRMPILVRRSRNLADPYVYVYLKVLKGNARKGEQAKASFTIKVDGKIDNRPVTLNMNTSEEGRTFEGIGGNFRLQNPKVDPEVINYNLNHLRVAWGRVEMPWELWQPKENMDPIKAAENGKLNPKVKAAMEMAQRLSKKGINVIVSDWWPPKWAIIGKPAFHPRPNGVWGNPLNPKKMKEIYKSITDYFLYLKKHYGVTVKMFSFNESDLGIYVRQTGEQHDKLIKGLGAYMAAHGLKTKLLLGDTSDANGYPFIKPALADPAAYPYIGAVDFHSWRGWADTTLNKWAHAAKKIHKPLLVGEGSINAAAWRYPQIFLTQTYAINEIGLYLKIMSIDQPESILQWQLTSDYSDMAGGGVFGNNKQPLHPTQRFWNLKQLSSTPQNLHYMPITVNRPAITCVALGNNSKDEYTIHLVNKGTTREVTLKGLPNSLNFLTMFVTNQKLHMKKMKNVRVKNGVAHFRLKSMSFTSLMHK